MEEEHEERRESVIVPAGSSDAYGWIEDELKS